MEFRYQVTEEFDGHKISDIMSRCLKLSSNMRKRIKLHGILELNGEHVRVIDYAHTGDILYAFYDDDAPALRQLDNIPILYEDDYLAVVHKPAGIVTHPTHGHMDDSLLTLLNSCDDESDYKPLHPVMRLDRETSGLLVIAKNGHVHSIMSSSDISKKYLAIVYGVYEPPCGTIDKYIKRREGSIMIRDASPEPSEGAHRSVTHYRTLNVNSKLNISLVEFILETGRCHQIRVHSLSEGHPLIGDGLYGPNSVDNPSTEYKDSEMIDSLIGRQALHAYQLEFKHPITDKHMRFRIPLPEDMKKFFPDIDI